MAIDIRRRELIVALGGAAAWPLAARGQQPNPIRRIGILADERWPPIDSLMQGLRNLGYVEGQNLEIVYRFAAGQAERFPSLAAELVALPVEVPILSAMSRRRNGPARSKKPGCRMARSAPQATSRKARSLWPRARTARTLTSHGTAIRRHRAEGAG